MTTQKQVEIKPILKMPVLHTFMTKKDEEDFSRLINQSMPSDPSQMIRSLFSLSFSNSLVQRRRLAQLFTEWLWYFADAVILSQKFIFNTWIICKESFYSEDIRS